MNWRTAGKKPEDTETAAWGALFALYALWGSVFLANHFSLESFPPFLLNAVRFLGGGGILYVILRSRGVQNAPPKVWGGSALVGGLLFVGGAGSLTVGQQWVASGLAATLIATVPLWTVLFVGIWERLPNRLEWAGLVIGIFGVALLNLEKGISGNPLGALWILGAAASWGLGSALSRRMTWLDGSMATAAQMISGGAMLLLLSLVTGERIGPLTPKAASGMVHLVVFASVIGMSIYRWLLRNVRPALATSYTLANPIIATFLGVLFAGEHVSAIALAAMAVILCGVALVFHGRERH
ncbi:MAG: drug/metabolite exporter YedA [Thermovirgaceae bacterium]